MWSDACNSWSNCWTPPRRGIEILTGLLKISGLLRSFVKDLFSGGDFLVSKKAVQVGGACDLCESPQILGKMHPILTVADLFRFELNPPPIVKT